MEEPSVDAKYLSSERKLRRAPEEKIRSFFLTSLAAARIRSSFSTSGTVKGSFSFGVAHLVLYVATGASSTGFAWSTELAFATETASSVMRTISAVLTKGEQE